MKSNYKKQQYLFISRKSSHYRYYKKLISYLGERAELHKLKTFVLPKFSQWSKVNQLNITDLVEVHLKRKQVRHPILKHSKFLNFLVCCFYRFREKSRASFYFQLFADHPCETVVIWNGMKQPNRTPYIVAQAAGKETMLFENGLLPNTTVLDSKGVNAVNSLPRDPNFYLNWQGKVEDADKTLVARKAHKNRKVSKAEITLPERYIFVPFQVPNDTQIVCHSPWVPDMESFYQSIENALTFLQQQADWKQVKFVIKEHPSWPRSFVDLHNKNSDIIFANENNTQALIENSLAVITINSTVGIESLLLNKNVITLGNAFFNIDGLVYHCADQLQLNNTLLTIEQHSVNQELVNKFLNYMKVEYLLPQSWNNLTNEIEHFEAVAQRLETPYIPKEVK